MRCAPKKNVSHLDIYPSTQYSGVLKGLYGFVGIPASSVHRHERARLAHNQASVMHASGVTSAYVTVTFARGPPKDPRGRCALCNGNAAGGEM